MTQRNQIKFMINTEDEYKKAVTEHRYASNRNAINRRSVNTILKSPHLTANIAREVLRAEPKAKNFNMICKNKEASPEVLRMTYELIIYIPERSREKALRQICISLMSNKNTPADLMEKVAEVSMACSFSEYSEFYNKGLTKLYDHPNLPKDLIPILYGNVLRQIRELPLHEGDVFESRYLRTVDNMISGSGVLTSAVVPNEIIEEAYDLLMEKIVSMPTGSMKNYSHHLFVKVLDNSNISQKLYQKIYDTYMHMQTSSRIVINSTKSSTSGQHNDGWGVGHYALYGSFLRHPLITPEIAEELVGGRGMHWNVFLNECKEIIDSNTTPDYLLLLIMKRVNLLFKDRTVHKSLRYLVEQTSQNIIKHKNLSLDSIITLMESEDTVEHVKRSLLEQSQVKEYYSQRMIETTGVSMEEIPVEWFETLVLG